VSGSGDQGDAGPPESEGRSDRQAEFLSSWKGSMLGRRPALGLPTRGLRGIVVIAASVAVVVGITIGGVAAVNAVAGSGKDNDPQTAALTSADLQTTAPSPALTEEPTATATQRPKKTRTKKATKPPVQTRTVTETAAPTGKPKAKKQTTKEKKKATKAAKKADATAGTVTATVGVIKNLVTNYCVDVPGLGAVSENTTVLQTNCFPGTSDNQEYQTVSQADGTFLLRNVKSQWCLDVPGTGAVGTNVDIVTLTCLFGDADNQMFKKQAQGDGFYLVNVKSGLCLDSLGLDAASSPVDSKLDLVICSPTDNDIWTFA